MVSGFDDVSLSSYDEGQLPTFPDLAGRHVFITGGGSGIGAYFTAAFARQGARVSFVGLREDGIEHTVRIIEEQSGKHPFFTYCDIRDIDALADSIEAAVAENGPVDVLINNAARDTRHSIESMSSSQWDDAIGVNLKAQHFAAKHVTGGMKAGGRGAIINVGSNSANLGLEGFPAYVTAKAAIVGLTRALARELGPDNIRANCLVPGWVLTERQKKLWASEEAINDCVEQQCLKRPLNGWDMVGPALFLASDASGAMSGQQVVVDGGRFLL